ncbi:MAG: oligoendopeptidase F, partial [Nanoarchaeota archaeon]
MVQWNLGDICNPEETEKMIDDAKIVVETIKKKKEFLNEEISDEEFLSIIHDMEKLTDVTSKLGGYAEMWLSENTNDSERTAFYAQISQMLTDLGNETLFFNIWFKNVSDETAQRLIDADPQYSYMLRTIRKLRKYTLEEREEQIMNLKDLTGTEALTNLYDIVTNKFTWEFEGKTLTQEEMTQYYRNYDGKKREQVYEMVLSRYAEEEAVLGEIYKNIASDWRNENIKLRGFETPIQVRNIGNDVPDEAVKNLMNVVRKNKYLFNEYMKLKFSLLGIERPKRTDLYAPREKEEDKYTYKEAQDLVL